MDTILKSIEEAIKKPVFAIRLISIFLILDFSFICIENVNLINFMEIEQELNFCTFFKIFFLSLMIGVCIKLVLGTIFSKIYLLKVTDKIQISENTKKCIDDLIQEAIEAKNSLSFEYLNKKKDEIWNKRCTFVSVSINLLLIILSYILSLCWKQTSLIFLCKYTAVKATLIIYIILLILLCYVILFNKDKYTIKYKN